MCNEKQEQQRIQQKTVLEVYQDWQQEQAQKMQEKTLHIKGTMDLFEHGMAPIHSTEIRRELLQGPPRGLTKAQKKLWKEKMGMLKILSEKREAFYKPINDIKGVAEEKLKDLTENSSVSRYMTVLQETEKAAELNVQESFFQKQEVADAHPEILQLQDILKELHSKSPEEFSNEELARLAEKYTRSQEGVQATSADRLKDAVRMHDKNAGVIFLIHSVTTLLAHHLDRLPADQIKLPMYSKLCGLVNGAGLVAAKLTLSEDYQKQLKEYHATEQKKKLETEQRNREAMERLKARRAFLRKGILGDEVPKTWAIGPYAELVEEKLGKRFASADCTMEDIASEVWEMEKNFESNLAGLERNLWYNTQRILPVYRKELISKIKEGHLVKLISTKQKEEELITLIQDAMKPMKEELDHCYERIYHFSTTSMAQYLRDENLDEEIEKLILEQNTFEEFKQKAEILCKQLKDNETICKEILKERRSPVTEDIIYSTFFRENKHLMLVGAQEEVRAKLSDWLTEDGMKKHLEYEQGIEQNVAEAMKEEKISQTWMHAVGQTLNWMDPKSVMKEKLHGLKKKIAANQDAFTAMMKKRRFGAAIWRKLLLWHEENISLEKAEFSEALQKYAEQLGDLSEEKLSLKEYMNGGQTAEEVKEAARVVVESNATMLKKELCGWRGFSDILRGHEDLVLQALDQVLQQGGLPYDFLQDIRSLDQLNYMGCKKLISYLRVNMSKAILGWSGLEGIYEEELRSSLMPELLMGKLDEFNFVERVSEETQKFKVQEKATRFRFMHLMKKGMDEIPGNAQYDYLDDTDSTALFTKDSRATRRLKRFENARVVWNAIQKNNLTKEFLRASFNVNTESKDYEKNLHTEIREMLNKVGALDQDQKLKKIMQAMTKQQIEEYINEIRLCGMENVLLSQKNDPEAYQAFTQKEHETYNQMLRETGTRATYRLWYLNLLLEKNCEESEREEMRQRFLPLVAGLKNTSLEKEKGNRKENFERFGVETWWDALKQFETYLDERKNQDAGESAEKIKEEQALDRIEQRKEQIRSYQDGLLAPVLPLLLEDKEFWTSMVTDEQQVYQSRLDAMIERIRTPMSILNRRYPYGKEYIRQLVNKLGKEILSEKQKDEQGWIAEFDAYFRRFCSHVLGGTSIEKRYQEWLEKDQKLASCFAEILLTNPEGLMILSDTKKLEAVLQECKNCMEPNQKAQETVIGQKTEWTEGEKTGFRLFLQPKIAFTIPEEFAEKLPVWVEEFEEKHRLMLEQMQKVTVPVMERQAVIFQEIQAQHHEGMLADGNDMQLIQELRSQIRGVGSPMLAAMGMKKMPTQKQIEKAKETLTRYQTMPQRVLNCLFERLLTGVAEKNVEQEAATLEWANNVIEEMQLRLKFKDHVADELLMFVSVRYHDKHLRPEDIEQAYKELSERHKKISKMMDPSLALALEFHPKSWEDQKTAVDYQLKRQENSLLMEKRRMVMEAMAVGIYTMEDEYFHALALRQTEYFQNAEAADAMFSELFTEQGIKDAEELQMLRMELEEYFHADLMKGQKHFYENRERIRKQAKNMLQDEMYRRSLVAGGKMASVGRDSLTAEEKKLHTMDSRETLEQILAQKENESFRKQYNQLNREQRQVFALSVLKQDQSSELPSVQFVRSKDLQISRSTLVQTQLEQYAAHETFKPEIPYDRVMDLLRLADGSMDGEAFDAAMELTQAYIQRYQEKISADWSRIGENL